jgi:hypothetical protein
VADSEPGKRDRLWRDTLFLGGAALAFYVLLRQQSFYTTDGPFILWRLLRGQLEYNNHFLYMPLLAAFDRVARPLLGSPFLTASLFSALGAGLAVLGAHRAALAAGLERSRAALATALFATAPPVAFFATVIEFHGPFLAAAALGWWLAQRVAAQPTPAGAILLGAASAFAFLLHSSALLLPCLLLPWWLAVRADAGLRLPPRDLGLPVLAALVHLLLVYALVAGFTSIGFGPFPPSYDAGKLSELSLRTLLQLPKILIQEWLWACVPLAALSAAGLQRGILWRTAAAWTGALAFLLLCLILLQGRPERGAYLLPVVFAAAILVAETLPRWGAGVALACGLLFASQGIRAHDDKGEGYRAYAQALADFDREQPVFLLLAADDELAAVLKELPAWFTGNKVCLLTEVAVHPPAVAAAWLPAFEAALQHCEQTGQQVLATETAFAFLRSNADKMPSGAWLTDLLTLRCELEPAAVPGFTGWRLRRKKA